MGYDCYFSVTYSNLRVFKLFQTLDYKIKTMSSCEEKLKQVFTENGEPLKTDEGHLVFQQADGSLVIVENIDAGSASTSNSDKRTADKRIKWCHNAIINLIAFREELDPEFRSTTQKNEVVWKKLASKMKEMGFMYTSVQCNDKWRYLKSRYATKKDNMGNRGSGEDRMDFECFERMDDFLEKKHSISPIAIASSSRGDTIPTDVEEQDLPEEATPPKQLKVKSRISGSIKGKKTPMQTIIDTMNKNVESRESSRTQRHEELLALRRESLNVFSDKMDALIKAITAPKEEK